MRKKLNGNFAGILLAALMCGLAALGVSSAYHDYVRGREHDAKRADLQAAADAVTNIVHSSCDPEQPVGVGSRVIDLPEDGNRWYLTVATDGRNEWAATWFDADPCLARLKTQTTFNHYTPSNQMFRWRESLQIGNMFPIVALQRADGGVVYKASGRDFPRSAAQLADELAQAIAHCPNCHPKPTPTPSPQPTPNVVPDMRPNDQAPQPDEEPSPLLIVVLGAAIGAAFKGVSHLKSSARPLTG
jgi:hypothetical protein